MWNTGMTKKSMARVAASGLGLRSVLTRKRSRAALCLLVVAALSACTSLRPIESSGGDLMAHVKTDDRIRVTMSGGAAVNLKVTAVGANEIEGTTPDGKERTIEVAEIEQIERRVPAPGKTAALAGTLGAFYAAYAVASAYGAILSGL